MAIRACNNPRITSSILSREITKLVAENAKAAVTNILQKRKADAAGSLVTLSMGEGEGGGSSSHLCPPRMAAPAQARADC